MEPHRHFPHNLEAQRKFSRTSERIFFIRFAWNNEQKNWSSVEIDVLTRSFLNTGEDAAVGTSQTGETFWGKVFDTFKIEQPNTERNAGALEDKWHIISREVTEFNGLVEALKAANESGKNEEDCIQAAIIAFKENKNNAINPKTKRVRTHDFKFLDSWRTMRLHPKWGKDGMNF